MDLSQYYRGGPFPSCRYFPRGKCTKGERCPFVHDASAAAAVAAEVAAARQPPPKVTTETGGEGGTDEDISQIVDVLRAALLKQWRGDGSHHTHTHGFHPRKATMHPHAVRMLLSLLPGSGPILDPFLGTGTTALEVMLQGRLAIGSDVSPLAIGIARATCWLPTVEQLEELRRAAANITLSLEDLEGKCGGDGDVGGIEFATGPRGATVREIVSRACEIATARVSLALWFLLDYEERTKLWNWQIDQPKVVAKTASSRFASTAQRYIDKLVGLRAAVREGTPMAEIRLGDAREKVREGLGFLDGILTSPPYPGVFDYVEENAVTEDEGQRGIAAGNSVGALLAVGANGAKFDGLAGFVERVDGGIDFELEIGSKRLAAVSDPVVFRQRWQEDTRAWLAAGASRLKLGGRIAILIGNQTNGINALESVKSAIPLCGGLGYKLRIIASASVREEDAGTRPWGGKWRPYRAEHTILLEKVRDCRSASEGDGKTEN